MTPLIFLLSHLRFYPSYFAFLRSIIYHVTGFFQQKSGRYDPDSFEIIDKIFQPKKADKKLSNEKGYSLHYGFIKDGEDLIDEVLVLAMRGPHSYTAEDTIEIDCNKSITYPLITTGDIILPVNLPSLISLPYKAVH